MLNPFSEIRFQPTNVKCLRCTPQLADYSELLSASMKICKVQETEHSDSVIVKLSNVCLKALLRGLILLSHSSPQNRRFTKGARPERSSNAATRCSSKLEESDFSTPSVA